MRQLIKFAMFILLLVNFWSNAVVAQEPNNNGKAQIMILGVYHFANPNADQVKTTFPDHLSDKKQKEIAELLDLLAKFKPTKIVVEAVPENEKVKKNYQEYLQGNYQLTANEIDQLCYRLAKRFDHQQIYLADHKIGFDLGPVFAAANETKNTEFLQYFQETITEVQEMQKRHETLTVREALIELNEPAFQDKTRDFYFQLARVKSKDNFAGADLLTSWYQRNFRIFSNLVQIIESPADRVLVIFGQGHAPYLREAVRSFSDLRLVEPNDYLKH